MRDFFFHLNAISFHNIIIRRTLNARCKEITSEILGHLQTNIVIENVSSKCYTTVFLVQTWELTLKRYMLVWNVSFLSSLPWPILFRRRELEGFTNVGPLWIYCGQKGDVTREVTMPVSLVFHV